MEPARRGPTVGLSMRQSDHLGSVEQRRALLAWARRVCEVELGIDAESQLDRPTIEGTFGGAFVTLWNRKTLRGCMGRFGATSDLSGTIQSVTKSSLQDPRFESRPVSAAELRELNIEVSILSKLTVTTDPASLIPGTHGIMIRHKGHSGCFLPKVATERGWSAEEFLSNCCTMKAGLPADAWRARKAEVQLFTADAFAESDYA